MQTSNPVTPRPPQPRQILLIGLPGNGKTTLALQFPNVYIKDADLNLDGPERRIRLTNPNLDYRYDYIKYDENGKEVPEAERFSRYVCLSEIATKDPWVKTIVDDGLTQISQYLIWEILAKQRKEKMEIRDWGTHTGQMYSLLVKNRVPGKTTIMTCHRDDKTKKKTDNSLEEILIGYVPSVREGLTGAIPGFFTDVWHVMLKEKPGGVYENIIETMPTGMMPFLKNSLGLPATMPATWEALSKYWKD